jgi:hypothetical protein
MAELLLPRHDLIEDGSSSSNSSIELFSDEVLLVDERGKSFSMLYKGSVQLHGSLWLRLTGGWILFIRAHDVRDGELGKGPRCTRGRGGVDGV